MSGVINTCRIHWLIKLSTRSCTWFSLSSSSALVMRSFLTWYRLIRALSSSGPVVNDMYVSRTVSVSSWSAKAASRSEYSAGRVVNSTEIAVVGHALDELVECGRAHRWDIHRAAVDPVGQAALLGRHGNVFVSVGFLGGGEGLLLVTRRHGADVPCKHTAPGRFQGTAANTKRRVCVCVCVSGTNRKPLRM